MTIGIKSSSWRWTRLAAGALVANLAACDSTPPATGGDAAVDNPPADMVAPPDVAPDVAPDMTQPPPDMVAPDAGPDAAPDAGPDATPDATPDVTPPPDVGPDTPGMPSMSSRPVVSCGTACTRPLDAIPNSTGTVVFFTAFTPEGVAGVFRASVPAAGAPAAPTLVASGNGLEFPAGITLSNDDSTLYVADQSADRGDQVGIGAVFSIPAGGGTPTVLNVGAALLHPCAISISSDGNDLLISGQQETEAMGRQRALFRVSRAGGSAAVVTTNLVDPSGVSQAATGTIIVHDTRRGGARSATAVTVGATGMNEVAGNLVANYPAGLAYSADGRAILFAGADPGVGPGLLTIAGADGRPAAPAELSAGMVTPLGLHRARMVDSWAVADEEANNTGQIFMVSMTR